MIHKQAPVPEYLVEDCRSLVQITLIMMTRNRQHHIRPLIDYYRDYLIHLIVADGSDSSYAQTTETSGAHPAFKVSYLHNSDTDSYVSRISTALQLTKMPLAMLVPDDEILYGVELLSQSIP